ncbi:Mycosubtilin synthase subunit A [Includes: Glutamate-1-semialdehyde aminotransferase (GSA-AT) [Durusdinium trenchii]|uniref:Mycosubtilin synthase subunit A n=2 Tax=Durusdinium trenchii TaxID=1381693 RepID=A0ABP0S8A7_9DINO
MTDEPHDGVDPPVRRSRKRDRLRQRVSSGLSNLSATWSRVTETLEIRRSRTLSARDPSPAFVELTPREPDAEAKRQDLWESVASHIGDEHLSVAWERWKRSLAGERNTFWSKLAIHTDSPRRDWDRISQAVRSGVPEQFRCLVWTVCTGATTKQKEAALKAATRESGSPEAVEALETLYPLFVSEGLKLKNEASAVIEVDVPRTGCPEALLEPLRHVLLAFAAKNPILGYCQSMNFIAAALLRYCDEESAFWILCSLIEDILPDGYYTRSMIGIRVDMLVLNSLVMKYLPHLHNHFAEYDVDLSPVSMNWFLCLYINTLPDRLRDRILDCILHEGSKVLFRCALGLLRCMESSLLGAQSLVEIYDMLRSPPEEFTARMAQWERSAEKGCDFMSDFVYGSWLQGFSLDILIQLRAQHLAAITVQAWLSKGDETRGCQANEPAAQPHDPQLRNLESWIVLDEPAVEPPKRAQKGCERVQSTEGVDVVDIDENSAMDISGSYGVNVCGYEKYKEFIEEGWKTAKKQGLFLGSLDKTVLDNIARLRKISGQPEVSFHMSGTEAVMCARPSAVRVARFNTRRPLVVTFGGAYHGWWDGMQPVAGNERLPSDVLCLKDMSNLSLKVIEARSSEIAAVLVNPLQCFHLNQSPPSDPVLSSNNRKVGPSPGYKEWLHRLRDTCKQGGIPLIFDEVYTGFRLHPRGAQGAYDVKADIVCYGKTLGGGLPIGVVCGPTDLMARGDARKAARVNYVIGTFAGHPFVMASMNAFLKWLETSETTKSYDVMHGNIDSFIKTANAKFQERGFPIQLTNWFSVWSILYTKPGRYHWLFQYFLKDAGVSLSWVGTGRLLFSLEWKKEDYDRLLERLLAACEQMQKGGWWEEPKANIKAKLGVEIGTAVFKNLLGLTG